MSKRKIFTIGFLLISALMLTSLYLQYFDNFVPCALCTLQRFCFILLGGLFFIGILATRKHILTQIILLFSVFASGLGIFFAGRQVWLQHFPPPSGSECGVSLEYMLKVLPLNEVLQKVFYASAECSQVGFSFLSLNMAEWSLLWFVVFLFLSSYFIEFDCFLNINWSAKQ